MWWLLELFMTFRPKNFQVKRLFKYENDTVIPVKYLEPYDKGLIEYYFGGQLYTHIGTWPLRDVKPKFTVPIQYAVFVDRDSLRVKLCTDRVKQYMFGPTESKVQFDTYIPVPHIRFKGYTLKINIKWKLYRKVRGTLYICNVLGQVTTVQV
jgi:hypothetical protein